MEGIAPPFLRLAIGKNIPAILGKRTGIALKKWLNLIWPMRGRISGGSKSITVRRSNIR